MGRTYGLCGTFAAQCLSVGAVGVLKRGVSTAERENYPLVLRTSAAFLVVYSVLCGFFLCFLRASGDS